MAEETVKEQAAAETSQTSSVWSTVSKIGSSTLAVAAIGAVGTWAWNTIDRHDKELVRMREEIRVLQQEAAKTDRHDTDIAILKVMCGMKENAK